MFSHTEIQKSNSRMGKQSSQTSPCKDHVQSVVYSVVSAYDLPWPIEDMPYFILSRDKSKISRDKFFFNVR